MAYWPGGIIVNAGVYVSARLGQLAVISYGLVAKAKIFESTTNAQTLVYVRDSVLSGNDAVVA